MDLVVFSKDELTVALRALLNVTAGNGVFTEAESDFVAAVAELHGVVVDPAALSRIDLADVAATIVDPHKRKRLVQLALIASLIEATPEQSTADGVKALAAALDIEDAGLKVMQEVVDGHTFFARIDMMRRIRPAMLGDDGSFLDMIKVALPILGFGAGDPSVAAKYEALGELPEGTFGRAFHDHYVAHGFAFPGQKGGMPERGVFHDAGHVLSGYDVDPAGEIQQAAFQSGFMRRDGFVFLLFGVLQFHQGIRLTPIAKSEKGFFDAKKILRAASRGAACKVDLSHDWDLFAVAHVPLDELRVQYGVSAPAT